MQEFKGIDYIKIDIANHYGLDKLNWDQRILWVDTNHDKLFDLIKEAEEPAQYYSAVKALSAAEEGIPNGHGVALDATSSGIQILSALTGDEKAATLCNLVNTGKREDIYTSVFKKMLQKADGNPNLKRDYVKKAIMTSCYGSEATPKKVFGEGALLDAFEQTVSEELPLVWEANKLMLDLWNPNASSYSWVMPDGFTVRTKVMAPSKETVRFNGIVYEITRYVNAPTKKGRALGANMTHSVDGMIVREVARLCKFDKKRIDYILKALKEYGSCRDAFEDKEEQDLFVSEPIRRLLHVGSLSGFYSVRILEEMTPADIREMCIKRPYILRSLLQEYPTDSEEPFDLLTIHDSFIALPNHCNFIRKAYRNELVKIARSNLMEFLLEQIAGKPISINKGNPDLWKKIQDAEYALS